MIRTSLLSMATLVLAGALANSAAPPEPAPEEGFRVYTISIRCRTRRLVGVYATAAEAFVVAAEARTRTSPAQVEVTTGSEGKTPPTGSPALYVVFTQGAAEERLAGAGALRGRDQGGGGRQTQEKEAKKVELVRDYAPKEVFHVYGLPCRTVAGTKPPAGELPDGGGGHRRGRGCSARNRGSAAK